MNNRISGVFTKVSGKKILERYPSLVSNSKNDQQIIAPTKISLFWIKSGSGWESTICYYTYPTGTSVDLSKVKKTIVFPRCYSKSLLIAGDEVQLKYWNEETQAYQEEFPKGVSIGWILLGQAYSNGNINIIQRSVRYSDPLLNDDGKQRMVALVDDSDKHIIALGFEDNIDYDYSDVLFALNIEKTNAVRLDNLHSLPSVKNDSEQAMYSKGTVAYEDQWPAKGDYDMNDLVVNYHSQRIKNTNSYGADKGKIVKTLDTFIPVNDGATYQNGFGIQFDDLNKADIESISLTCDGVEQPVAWEDGQSKPVLILSDNMGANINKVFVLTIVYKKAQDESKLACPYNPFLIANSKNGRGAEVHLTGYLPTDKAMYRGTGEDLDRDMNNNPMYYVSRDNMPFAIHITGQYFDYPSERQSILVKYPEFRKWVESKGETNEDWFLK